MIKVPASLLAASLLLGLSTVSHAEIIVARTSLPTQSFTVPTFVAINGAANSVSFTVQAASTIAISFTAECAITGASSENVSIQIFVDATPIAPTVGTLDAFCSAAVTPANTDGATSAAVVTTARVEKGAHTIRVQATPTGGVAAGRTGRLEARSLVVWQ